MAKKVDGAKEKAFKLLIERGRRTNTRLIRYNLPPAALPTMKEYRAASYNDKKKLTNHLTNYVENASKEYNLKRAKEFRESGRAHGTRPAEKTAIRESVIASRNVTNHRSKIKTDEFHNMYNLALSRFKSKLVMLGEAKPKQKRYYPTIGIWRNYSQRLEKVFSDVKTNYGSAFANVFGKKIIDNWQTMEDLNWEFESGGEGASKGFYKAMNFLIKFAKETQEEYNFSVMKDDRKNVPYIQREIE